MAKAKAKVKWTAEIPNRSEIYNAKRMAVIREAAKAFGKKGFHNTSLDDVAEALNVTKPALYYYVKTKHEILYESHNIVLNLGNQARAAAADASTPEEQLRTYLLNYIELAAEHVDNYGVLRESLVSLPEEFRTKIKARMREADRQLRRMVQANIDAGTLPPCDPAMAVAFFMGAINYISRWYDPEGPYSGPQVAEMFTQFILTGLKGGAGEAPVERT